MERAEVIRRAEAAIKAGLICHFKFSCTTCGERCTLQESNTLYERGECFACGEETDLKDPRADLGFLVIREVAR